MGITSRFITVTQSDAGIQSSETATVPRIILLTFSKHCNHLMLEWFMFLGNFPSNKKTPCRTPLQGRVPAMEPFEVSTGIWSFPCSPNLPTSSH